jgi:hypothetical protein
MRIRKKQEFKIKRKNFLPAFIVTIVLWILLALIIFFVDPESLIARLSFFVIFFLSCLFSLSLIMASLKRGFIYATSVTLFIFLSYLGVGNLLNAILLAAAAISIDLYIKSRG